MRVSQSDKAARFRALHQGPGVFVIPNPWDAGSARILAGLGFQALATSSGASAGVLGRRDGKVTREEALALARAIVVATDLPVSADLEKGFGDAPAAVAETIRLAAEVGLVGGSIEDATGDKNKPLYDIGHATERVEAAVAGGAGTPLPIHLDRPRGELPTRQPESGGHDQTFAGVREGRSGRAVCTRPTRPCVCACGLRRSVEAGQLHGRHQGQVILRRRARGGRRQADQPRHLTLPRGDERPAEAAREVQERGTFGYLDHAMPTPELNALMEA